MNARSHALTASRFLPGSLASNTAEWNKNAERARRRINGGTEDS